MIGCESNAAAAASSLCARKSSSRRVALLLCALAAASAYQEGDACAVEQRRGAAALRAVPHGRVADRAEARIGSRVITAYKKRRPPIGKEVVEGMCHAFYDLEVKVCGGATASIKAHAPERRCPERGRRKGANGPENPRIVATTHVDGFVVLYTDWSEKNGTYERSKFLAHGTIINGEGPALGTPSMIDAPYGDWAPFLYEDVLYAHTQLNGDDAVTLRLGDLHSYNCPGAGEALRKALGGETPLFDSVRIEPGSNAVLIGDEYVAVGKTVRHLGHEVQLKALFAYAFSPKPPFCITKTTPEFHAPVPHASSSETFDALIPRKETPGKHREGVQTPFSLVVVEDGLRLAFTRKHSAYSLLLNKTTLFKDSRRLKYGADATIAQYLKAVYPAMNEQDNTKLVTLYESLDYFYRGPALPYVPQGVYYSAEDATTDIVPTQKAIESARQGDIHGVLYGSYIRWKAMLRRVSQREEDLKSSWGARLGPAPSWTHASAAVKYPLYPLGLSEENDNVLGRPDNPLDGRWDVPTRKKKFTHLKTGDYVEIEQYGGPDWVLSEFPITSRGIAGLFCNVWRGTGLGLKVVAPFVSRSKGAAVADLLREVGRRQDVSGGEDYVSALATLSGVGSPDIDERRRLVAEDRELGVGHWVKSLFSSKPQKQPQSHEMRAVHLAVGFLALPIPCATSWDAIDPRWRRWRDSAIDAETASFSPPAGAWRAKRPISELFDELALRKEAPGNASLAALHWIYGLCSKSPYYSGPANKRCAAERRRGNTNAEACSRRWLAWDNLLMVLSCAVGSKTLILDASPNDNGLFHEELIDYDVPGSWKTIDDGRSLNPLSECLAPFDDGRRAPSRKEVLEHWRATQKFGLVDPLSGKAAPCELVGSDGTALGEHNGGGYLACANSMSESHALCVRDRERTKRAAGARRAPGCGR